MKILKRTLRMFALALIIGLACILPMPITMHRKDNLPSHTIEQIDSEHNSEDEVDIKHIF